MPKRLRWCEDEIKKLRNRGGDFVPGSWMETETSGWVAGSTFYADAKLDTIDDSTGDFDVLNETTIVLPDSHTMYLVEWVFKFQFKVDEAGGAPPASWFTGGAHWSLWHGGPSAPAGSVQENTVFDAVQLGLSRFETIGDPTIGDIVRSGAGGATGSDLWVWRGVVSVGGRNLSLGLDLNYHFDHVPDFGAGDHPYFLEDPATLDGTGLTDGSGFHLLKIASIG
jgi:hypothetical protein